LTAYLDEVLEVTDLLYADHVTWDNSLLFACSPVSRELWLYFT